MELAKNFHDEMNKAGSAKQAFKIGGEAWLAFGLAVLTCFAFWPVKNFEFLNYDDPAYVTEVGQMRNGFSSESLVWAFTDTRTFGGYPVTSLSYLLDSQLFGIKPGAFHFTNLLLHIANTLLVFLLFQRMTGKIWRSAFLAGLFALHPLHVEPVAWVSGRKDLLCAFFSLLAVGLYVRYAQVKSKLFYALALLCFALGLMSKASMVTLPFLLLVLDFWPLNRISGLRLHDASIQNSKFKSENLGQLLLEKIPFLALAIAATFLTYWIQNKGGVLASAANLSFGTRSGNALISYLRYIGKMFWPGKLAVIYPYPDPWAFWQIIGDALILLAISWFALQSARRQPYFITGWFWFLGTLVPVIGLIQIGTHSMADRYTYLPLSGLFFALIWGVCEFAQRRSVANSLVQVSAPILLLGCVILSRIQLRYWQNSETLLRHAVKVTKKNYLAYNNLGAALAESGKLDQARECFVTVLKIEPEHLESRFNLALLWIRSGDLAKACQDLEVVLSNSPDHARAHYNLANILDEQGDTVGAQAHYVEALNIQPDYAEAHNNLAILLVKEGQPDAGISQFRQALKCNPDYIEALNNLGSTLVERDQPREALPFLTRALQINPNYAEPHYQIAMILSAGKNMEPAIAHYKEAIRLKPDWLKPLINLAWILATNPDEKVRDGKLAIEFAERACALAGNKSAEALDTLAAAYAEAGQFDEAIIQAKVAIALSSGQEEIKKGIEARLRLYQSRRPFREGVDDAGVAPVPANP